MTQAVRLEAEELGDIFWRVFSHLGDTIKWKGLLRSRQKSTSAM